MAEFLLVMTIITDVIMIGVGVQAFRMGQRIRTRFARLQSAIVVLLCAAGVISSIQDIGFQMTQMGWLSESVGKQFVGRIQAVLVVGGLIVIAPVLVILRKLTAEFAQTESLTDALVNRLPAGLSVEMAGLTPREREVVATIGEGNVSDSAIAATLFVSSSTAATHVRNIMKKTGIKRRGDLALLALELDDTG